MKAFFALVMLFAMTAPAQQATTAAQAPNGNTSYIDENGTAHVTRVIPIPEDLSPEAKKSMSRRESDAAKPEDLALRRKMTDQWQNHAGEVSRKAYPVNLTNETMAGVPVRVMTPLSGMVTDRVLINLHGGGFDSDSGSLTESIPMANLTHIKVIAVLYRLAPEHPYPAAVEDAVAVYKEVLKKYRPEHIGVYGTSAGAILTSELAVRLKQLKLPLPGALGVFSGLGDA